MRTHARWCDRSEVKHSFYSIGCVSGIYTADNLSIFVEKHRNNWKFFYFYRRKEKQKVELANL